MSLGEYHYAFQGSLLYVAFSFLSAHHSSSVSPVPKGGNKVAGLISGQGVYKNQPMNT